MITRTARRTVPAVVAAAVAASRAEGLTGPMGEGAGRVTAHLAGEAIARPGGAGTLIGLHWDVRPQTAAHLRSEDRGDDPPSEVHR
jgi:hypothetical protein